MFQKLSQRGIDADRCCLALATRIQTGIDVVAIR